MDFQFAAVNTAPGFVSALVDVDHLAAFDARNHLLKVEMVEEHACVDPMACGS